MPAYDPQRTRRRPTTDDSAPAPVDALLDAVPVTPVVDVAEVAEVVEAPPPKPEVAPPVIEAAVEDLEVRAPQSPSVAPMPRSGGLDKRLVLVGAAVLAVLALVVLGRRRRRD